MDREHREKISDKRGVFLPYPMAALYENLYMRTMNTHVCTNSIDGGKGRVISTKQYLSVWYAFRISAPTSIGNIATDN